MIDMTFDASLIWWISAVELPLFSALAAWLAKRHQALARRTDEVRRELSEAMEGLSGRLSRFRLEAAANYATQNALRESESRLSRHLFRIERKLDDLLVRRLDG